MSVSATKPSIVWICHERPKTSTGPVASASMPTMPSRSSAAPGNEVEPARAVQEHEADVAPRVAEAVELRLADARVVVDRDLAHREAAAVRLEDHLRRELHSRRVQVEGGERVLADGAHAAVRVGDLHAEEQVEHPREDRVSDEAVQERHRVAVDRPLEARADDEVVALLEPVDERRELLQRVRLVGVAHHDVLALRLGEPGQVGAPVAAALLGDDARAVLGRDLGRAVGRGVVDHDHLARRPERRMPSSACSTTLPTASSSFRQGMTTEICGVGVATAARRYHARQSPSPRRLPSRGVPTSRSSEGRTSTAFARPTATRMPRLALLADMCRLNALVAVKRAGSGHLGSSFSALDIVVHLLYEELNVAELGFDASRPRRLLLLEGARRAGLYAALYGLGVIPRAARAPPPARRPRRASGRRRSGDRGELGLARHGHLEGHAGSPGRSGSSGATGSSS